MIDYSKIRGFNYTQNDSSNDADFWRRYNHDLIDRDMGYAERLNLNSTRIFLVYKDYKDDPEKYMANVRDFVHTAWSHGISTSPILFLGFYFHPDDGNFRWAPPGDSTLMPITKTISDPSCWHIGEKYVDDMITAIGNEPGLLFWDIANEPGYMDNFVSWYDDEPEWVQRFRKKPEEIEEFRRRQKLTWDCVRHFCEYTKKKDPDHDIGVGNCFIWDTEESGTADIVDVIVFHDYSSTRARLRYTYDMAVKFGKKYNKPVINNETCCLCRANPYDMTLELCDEYHMGWYLFELMIGKDMWNRVHGICYPDGTVRDPSIVSALFGFYRNRGESAVRSDVNQENYVTNLVRMTQDFIVDSRVSARRDHSGDVNEALELCEMAANLLEAGQLCPMDYPPTARIAAYRRQTNPDLCEITDWLCDMVNSLKKACHLV